MSTAEIRRRLVHLHAYAGLRLALEPGDGGTRNPQIRTTLNAIGDFLKTASSRDLQTRGRELESLLRKGTKPRKGLVPSRDAEAIGRDFIILGRDQDLWRYGVTYGWLEQQFCPPILGLPSDLPPHARVGLGVHAGSAAIEEATLLDDSFFLAAMTARAYEIMAARARQTVEPRDAAETQAMHNVINGLNMNVGTFARLAVVTAASFVESFINSVGASHAARHSEIAEVVIEQLTGMRKGRFLSLETKLERLPALIRSDGTSPLRITDEAQREEPFRRFLAETKEVRDAAMHYSPMKAPIICTPQEWVARANTAVDDAVEVAQQFWSACYPGAAQPSYVYGLEREQFQKRAKDRLEVVSGTPSFHAPAT